MAFRADDLIALARELGRFPDDALSSGNLLLFADEVIRDYVLPIIRSASAEYYVASEDTAIVSGTTAYRIPERAQGGALTDIVIVNPASEEIPTTEINPQDAFRFRRPTGGTIDGSYVTRGNLITLLVTPTVSGSFSTQS